MKTRTILGALVMAAVIGSSVGVGYAGSAGGGLGNGAALFQCYVIVGGAQPSPSIVLEVNDLFTNPHNVSVGKLRLVCTPTDGTLVPPSTLQEVNPFASLDHITCYDIAAVKPPLADVTLSDSFSSNKTVRLGPPQVLCTAACTGTNCAAE